MIMRAASFALAVPVFAYPRWHFTGFDYTTAAISSRASCSNCDNQHERTMQVLLVLHPPRIVLQ